MFVHVHGDMPESEIKTYVDRAKSFYGDRLTGIDMTPDGDEVELRYTLTGNVPFQRIRRITGYLVGTTERFNDAKRAEEKDRVKHDAKGAYR